MGACCLGLEESSTIWVVLFHGCCHDVGMLKCAYLNNAAMTVERRSLGSIKNQQAWPGDRGLMVSSHAYAVTVAIW